MKNEKIFEKFSFEIICVIFLSIIVMFLNMGFNTHLFLVDDNLNQFYPVIKKSFDQFFKTGIFPVYDFFQQKGMIIADQGYYGQTNIVLFIAYLMEKFLHFSDCINLYAVICVIIGNVGLLCLFKKININFSMALITIGMLTTSSGFLNFGYWYYIFNNYAVIPYMLLGICYIINGNSYVSYFLTGIILAFSCTLGNLQYTFYHYMTFCIILIIYIFVSGKFKKLKQFMSNLGISVFLSSPILLMALKASSRRELENEFFSLPVSIRCQSLLSVLPYPVFRKIFPEYAKNGSMGGFSFLYTGFFLPCLVFLGMYLIHNMFSISLNNFFKKLKQIPIVSVFVFLILFSIIHSVTKNISHAAAIFILCILLLVAYEAWQNNDANISMLKDAKNQFLISIFLCIIFFAFFEAGKGYVVADLLYHIPVVNRFRFLFKISFVVSILMSPIAAYVIQKMHFPFKKTILCIFIVIGLSTNYCTAVMNTVHDFFNNYHRASSRYIYQYDDLKKEMEQNGMNLYDYRILPFLSTTKTNQYAEYFKTQMIASNMASLFGYYSIGGYDESGLETGYNAVNKLLTDYNFHYRRQAAVSCYDFFNNCQISEEFKQYAVNQLSNGSIKYCLFSSDSPFIDDFIDFIENNEKMSIVRNTSLSNGTIIFELEGNIIPLFKKSHVVNKDKLDAIIFECNEKGEITTSFTYDPKLIAYSIQNGKDKHFYEISNNDYQNAVIHIDNLSEDNLIYFQYENAKESLILLGGLLLSLLTLSFVLCFCIKTVSKNEILSLGASSL